MQSLQIPENFEQYEDISMHVTITDALPYLYEKIGVLKNVQITDKKYCKDDIKTNLVIDATGFNRAVQKSGKFKSINNEIPNDKALIYRSKYTNKKKQQVPYSRFNGMNSGWVWNIPLRDEIAFGYVHESKYDVKSEFIKYLENEMEVEISSDDIGEIKFKSGYYDIHLKNNICAIGLSSCFIEPLESTGLWFTTTGLERLSEWIDGKITEKEYNKKTNNNFISVLEFIKAHYKFNNRKEKYWLQFADIGCKLYKSNNIFPPEAWNVILSGFGQEEYKNNEELPIRELIAIKKGMPYYKWLEKRIREQK
jgi:hypothetical protein